MKKSMTNKIIALFLGIIFFVIFSIVSYSKSVLKANNEILIDKKVVETTKSINLYLEQYFKLKHMDFNKVALSVEARSIVNDLSYRLDNKVFIYNSKSELVYPNSKNIRELKKTKDMDKAIKKKLSYTIEYEQGKAMTYVSYPITNNGNLVGIIRYVNDDSALYKQGEKFINKILFFSIIIFVVSIFIAYILAKQLTKPITTLASKTKEISEGNFDVNIDTSAEDELGMLSQDFKTMAEKIKYQIKVIEKDRDDLKELSEKQKNFFDNVTHELKTPMTTIIGYSEIIKDNQFTDEEFFNKGIDRIISESTRLNRMIVQLIEISKNSMKDFDYEMKKLDISKIVANMCEDMTYKAKKYNINIEMSLEDNIKVIANEDKIKEVIINLIDNSIKYGRVNTSIKISTWKCNGYANILVKDSGEGIEKYEIENILSPFYRVSKSETRELGSTGLGLAIVQSIVESYNGEIKIESEIGIGTEVLIKIPTIG